MYTQQQRKFSKNKLNSLSIETCTVKSQFELFTMLTIFSILI